MDKATKTYLKKICERFNIEYPHNIQTEDIQPYIEGKLKNMGLSEFDIRQEFSSDWEVLIL